MLQNWEKNIRTVIIRNEFNARMSAYAEKLQEYFVEGDKLKTEIMEQLKKVKYE